MGPNVSRPPVGGGEGLITGITSSRFAGGFASSSGLAQIRGLETGMVLAILIACRGGESTHPGGTGRSSGLMAGALNNFRDSTRFSADAEAALSVRAWPKTGTEKAETEKSSKTDPAASFICRNYT
jgi:hypothetical protein